MIKYELPTLYQEFKDGEVKTTRGKMNCYLDVSAASQEVWERECPRLAEKEGLFDYIDRISKSEMNMAKAISALKAIYCFMVFEKPITMIEFLRMFSFTDQKYIDDLTNTLRVIFTAIYPEAKKNYF